MYIVHNIKNNDSTYDGYFVFEMKANGYEDRVYFKHYDQAEEYACMMAEKHNARFSVNGYAHADYLHVCGYREYYTEEDMLAICAPSII